MFRIEEAAGAAAGFVSDHRWMICQVIFAAYMIILSVSDIRKRKMSLLLILSGILPAAAGIFTDRDLHPAICAAGAGVGIVFLIVSKVTKESFGYGDSLVIVIMGMMVGFWGILSVLLAAFFLAAAYSSVLLFFRHFSRKASFPFVPFLAAAYIGGMLVGGY